MLTVTGLIAVFLVLLSGPYDTLQRRWSSTWGPRVPVWAHGNISVAAAVAVFVHIAPKLGKLGPGYTWIATALFAVSVLSGLYVATGLPSRARWLRVHRPITYAFYLTVLPHVVGELLGWGMIGAVATGWALWNWRKQVRERLSRTAWPFSIVNTSELAGRSPTPRTVVMGAVTSWRAMLSLVVVAGVVLGVLLGPSLVGLEEEVEVKGRIVEVQDGSFTLMTEKGTVRVNDDALQRTAIVSTIGGLSAFLSDTTVRS